MPGKTNEKKPKKKLSKKERKKKAKQTLIVYTVVTLLVVTLFVVLAALQLIKSNNELEAEINEGDGQYSAKRKKRPYCGPYSGYSMMTSKFYFTVDRKTCEIIYLEGNTFKIVDFISDDEPKPLNTIPEYPPPHPDGKFKVNFEVFEDQRLLVFLDAEKPQELCTLVYPLKEDDFDASKLTCTPGFCESGEQITSFTLSMQNTPKVLYYVCDYTKIFTADVAVGDEELTFENIDTEGDSSDAEKPVPDCKDGEDIIFIKATKKYKQLYVFCTSDNDKNMMSFYTEPKFGLGNSILRLDLEDFENLGPEVRYSFWEGFVWFTNASIFGEVGMLWRGGRVRRADIYHIWDPIDNENVVGLEGSPLAPDLFKKYQRQGFAMYDDFSREPV